MVSEKVEIIGNEEIKSQVKPEDLDPLIHGWMEEMYQPIQVPRTGIRALVDRAINSIPSDTARSAVMEVREGLRDRFPGLSETRSAAPLLKAQSRHFLERDLDSSLSNGDMVVAKRDGEVVSMVRFFPFTAGKNSYVEGDMVELGKGFTLPEARRKGIYREVREQAISNIKAKYGDVPILTATKTDAIKKLNRAAVLTQTGWQEISFEDYLRIKGDSEYSIDLRKPDIIEKGWTAFLYIPPKDTPGTSAESYSS